MAATHDDASHDASSEDECERLLNEMLAKRRANPPQSTGDQRNYCAVLFVTAVLPFLSGPVSTVSDEERTRIHDLAEMLTVLQDILFSDSSAAQTLSSLAPSPPITPRTRYRLLGTPYQSDTDSDDSE
jgi:hypothetical protein